MDKKVCEKGAPPPPSEGGGGAKKLLTHVVRRGIGGAILCVSKGWGHDDRTIKTHPSSRPHPGVPGWAILIKHVLRSYVTSRRSMCRFPIDGLKGHSTRHGLEGHSATKLYPDFANGQSR